MMREAAHRAVSENRAKAQAAAAGVNANAAPAAAAAPRAAGEAEGNPPAPSAAPEAAGAPPGGLPRELIWAPACMRRPTTAYKRRAAVEFCMSVLKRGWKSGEAL